MYLNSEELNDMLAVIDNEGYTIQLDYYGLSISRDGDYERFYEEYGVDNIKLAYDYVKEKEGGL